LWRLQRRAMVVPAKSKGRTLFFAELKPKELPPNNLAGLACMFVLGGIDFINDDYGIANQSFCPFDDHLRAFRHRHVQRPTITELHLIVDSAGGAGDWLFKKHGNSKRRSWRISASTPVMTRSSLLI
jgi:hypothetical protein